MGWRREEKRAGCECRMCLGLETSCKGSVVKERKSETVGLTLTSLEMTRQRRSEWVRACIRRPLMVIVLLIRYDRNNTTYNWVMLSTCGLCSFSHRTSNTFCFECHDTQIPNVLLIDSNFAAIAQPSLNRPFSFGLFP